MHCLHDRGEGRETRDVSRILYFIVNLMISKHIN
jgi:hypothetical protein